MIIRRANWPALAIAMTSSGAVEECGWPPLENRGLSNCELNSRNPNCSVVSNKQALDGTPENESGKVVKLRKAGFPKPYEFWSGSFFISDCADSTQLAARKRELASPFCFFHARFPQANRGEVREMRNAETIPDIIAGKPT